MNWPWTNTVKLLEKRSKEALENPDAVIRLECVADLFDRIDSYNPTIFERMSWSLKDWSWQVYRWFNPAHQQLRKAIPREFVDISSLIVTVNFEFIKSFHDNEMNIIDWDADELHREFRDWINDAYAYITQERPKLEQELSQAYPPRRAKGPYEELYADVIRIEKTIQDRDTAILMEMVKRREMFWS